MKGRLVASVAIIAWAALLIGDMRGLKKRDDFQKRFPEAAGTSEE